MRNAPVTGAEDKEPETTGPWSKTDGGLKTGGLGPGAELYQRAVRVLTDSCFRCSVIIDYYDSFPMAVLWCPDVTPSGALHSASKRRVRVSV